MGVHITCYIPSSIWLPGGTRAAQMCLHGRAAVVVSTQDSGTNMNCCVPKICHQGNPVSPAVHTAAGAVANTVYTCKVWRGHYHFFGPNPWCQHSPGGSKWHT
jgi:hypothetical protein